MPAPNAPPPAAEPDHAIRLRGPWGWTMDGAAEAPVSLPHAAAIAGTLVRPFNTPTGLEDGTRVRLRIEADGAVGVSLNGEPVAAGADVTDRLGAAGARCRLELAVPAGATVSAAALELFEPRYEY